MHTYNAVHSLSVRHSEILDNALYGSVPFMHTSCYCTGRKGLCNVIRTLRDCEAFAADAATTVCSSSASLLAANRCISTAFAFSNFTSSALSEQRSAAVFRLFNKLVRLLMRLLLLRCV
jgi:hypothetical protein